MASADWVSFVAVVRRCSAVERTLPAIPPTACSKASEIVECLLALPLACLEIDFDGVGQIEHDGAQHGAAELHHLLMVTARKKQNAFADELQRDLFEYSSRSDAVAAAVPLRIEAELTAHVGDCMSRSLILIIEARVENESPMPKLIFTRSDDGLVFLILGSGIAEAADMMIDGIERFAEMREQKRLIFAQQRDGLVIEFVEDTKILELNLGDHDRLTCTAVPKILRHRS